MYTCERDNGAVYTCTVYRHVLPTLSECFLETGDAICESIEHEAYVFNSRSSVIHYWTALHCSLEILNANVTWCIFIYFFIRQTHFLMTVSRSVTINNMLQLFTYTKANTFKVILYSYLILKKMNERIPDS